MHGDVFSRLLNRPADSHKYQFGHVLVIGGSPGMVGAPLLAGLAALRSGAGLVTIAAAAPVAGKLERRVKEIMTLALPADATGAAARIEDFVHGRKVSVLVIGPGLDITADNRVLLESLLRRIKLPVILDGGALGLLRHHMDLLDKTAPEPLILTPHTGEFQKLVDEELPKEREHLKPLAAAFTRRHGVTLVLKGHPTYVARPSGQIYENPTGNPGLATAGTGDVLSGVIAGLVAQSIEPAEAAETGVYLHGLAGDIAATDKTQPGMIAGDVIEALPRAFKKAAGKDGKAEK